MVALVSGVRPQRTAVDIWPIQRLVHAGQPPGAEWKLMLRIALVISLLPPLICGCVSRSKGTLVAQPPSPTARAAPTTQPILYRRTGGLAGTDDRVVIWPDG